MVVGRYVNPTIDQKMTRDHSAGLLFSLCSGSLRASTHAKANDDNVIAKQMVIFNKSPVVIVFSLVQPKTIQQLIDLSSSTKDYLLCV
jgi:hypothetical protein